MKADSQQRVRQYATVDGLLELVAGLVYLLIALTFGISAFFPTAFPPLVFLPLFIGIPLLFQGVLVLKRRLTYPRTGYAVLHYPRYFVPVLFVGLFLLIVVEAFFLLPAWPSLDQGFPLLAGILTAGLLWWLGAGLIRFHFLAAVSLTLGLGLTLLIVDELLGVVLFCTTTGLLLVVSGAYELRRYLRSSTER